MTGHWCRPFLADEPPGSALSRHAPVLFHRGFVNFEYEYARYHSSGLTSRILITMVPRVAAIARASGPHRTKE